MKIGLFTDIHYCETDYLGELRQPRLAFKRTCSIMEHFKAEGVELCFCLGDLTDHAEGNTRSDIYACYKKIMDMIKSYEIPFYLVPGNHDYLMLSESDLVSQGYHPAPYSFIKGSHLFVVLDSNYRSNMQRFDIAGVEWTDSNLPPEQIEFLKEALDTSDLPVIVLLHENLDPTVEKHHIVKNASYIREIIHKSNKVKYVIQGHFHSGKFTLIDGIPYITLKAVCEQENDNYMIIEL
ncbi:MAG: metallophosphoesterase [Clostridia bacterium]|nr:metallophosphoesterase [Clostridia bacterium]